MKWLIEAAQDDDTNRVSSTRIAVLIASVTLSLSTLVLTFAVLWIPEITPALSVTAGGLAGMSGGSYMANRFARPRFTERGMRDE